MARRKKRSIEAWLNRIDSSRRIYSKWHKNYKSWVQFYRGMQWDIEESNKSLNPIVINYVFNTIKTMVPTLFFKNPRIFATPTRPEFQNTSELVQMIVNYDWRILGLKNELKRSILRALIGGLSYIETGYVFEVEPVEAEGELTDAELDAAIRPVGQQQGEPMQQEYTEFRIKKDMPFAISRSILDVVVDPFANVHEEAAWHAIREIKPIEFIRRDSRFEATQRIEANAKFDDKVVLNTFRDEARKSDDLKFVEMWHVTDKWEGKTMTLARGHASRLRQFDTPDGYDLVPLFFNEDPEQPQPLSVVELMRDQQMEKNRIRSFMLEHIKRTLPRIAADRTQITDEEDYVRLTNSELDEVVPLPGDPNQLLKPINFPSLPAEMFGVDTKINEDMLIASGLSDFQRGQAAKVPSATEAQLIEQASRLRVDEGLDVVSDIAATISRNIFALRQKFTTGDQVVPIVGENMATTWRTYTRDEIQGDFEFTVDYGSTQKRDQDFMKNLWIQAGPVLSQLSASPNPADKIIGRQMAKAFEIPAPVVDEIFPPAPPAGDALAALTGGAGAPQTVPAGGGIPSDVDIESILGIGRDIG